jgi:hypothetical protein
LILVKQTKTINQNNMNKIKTSILIGILASMAFVSNAAVLATNVTTGGTFLLSTNRASIYQVELTSTASCRVDLFDSDSLADPYFGTNYVSGAFPYRTTYSTNYVTTYIGSNGFTNTVTNVGLWTLTLTNAANTNALPTLGSFVVGANTYAVYNVDELHARGVTFRSSTNVNLVLSYRTAQ